MAWGIFNEFDEYDNAKSYINDMYKYSGYREKNSMNFNFWEEVMDKIFEIYDSLRYLGYEDREDQQNMTMDIIQAIEENQNIVIEARSWNWEILCIFNTINVIL